VIFLTELVLRTKVDGNRNHENCPCQKISKIGLNCYNMSTIGTVYVKSPKFPARKCNQSLIEDRDRD